MNDEVRGVTFRIIERSFKQATVHSRYVNMLKIVVLA